MKKLLVLLLFLPAICMGQARKLTAEEINSSGPQKLIFASATNNCVAGAELAQEDILRKVPFLCLAGGIAPVAHAPTDSVFEQKFGVYYYEYGCSGASPECIVAYNGQVLDFLTATFGNKWRKTVRKDIIGYKQWRAKHG